MMNPCEEQLSNVSHPELEPKVELRTEHMAEFITEAIENGNYKWNDLVQKRQPANINPEKEIK